MDSSGGRNTILIQASSVSTRLRQGEPKIPFVTVNVLLPYGKAVRTVKVQKSAASMVNGVVLEYCGKLMPFSAETTPDAVWPDAKIYESDAPYPGIDYELVGTQEISGYTFAVLNLFPVQYHPKKQTAECFQNMEVAVELEDSDLPGPGPRSVPEDLDRVTALVVNPTSEVLSTYGDRLLDGYYGCQSCGGSADFKYVIITKPEFAAAFQALVLQKTTRQDSPITATVRTTEDLRDARYNPNSPCMVSLGYYDSPAYNDQPARIRNFIRYAHHCWGTQYVLLGGDADGCTGPYCGEGGDNVIPVRGLWAHIRPGSQQPYGLGSPVISDLYYACLSGSYNGNGNERFGEQEDNPDLGIDVLVGRAPVDSLAEVQNFCNKIAAYENASAPAASTLMVGEALGDSYHCFGYMTNFGDFALDEIHEGSSEHGALSAGYPPVFSVQTIYDRQDADGWTKTELIDKINQNTFHSLDGLGHGATLKNFKLCHRHYPEPNILCNFCGGTDPYQIDDLAGISPGKLFFVFTEACFPNAFDNYHYWQGKPGDPGGFTKTDCFGESLLLGQADRGAWSYVGNTRFGVGGSDTTDFPACRFHRAFMDSLFHFSIIEQHSPNLGWALARAKTKLLGQISEDYMLYSYYEVMLSGDPETRFRIPSPHMPVADLYLTRETYCSAASIVGTASRGFSADATFGSFSLAYRPKVVPPSGPWYTTGMTPTGGGTSEVLLDPRVLGNWDLSQLPPGLPKMGFYEVQLSVLDAVGQRTDDTVEYELNRFVKDTWVVPTGALVDSSPVLVNLDGDPELEIVVGSYDCRVYALNCAGTTLWTSPVLDSGVTASPAVADLDNDGEVEIVVATNNAMVSDPHSVYALRGSSGQVKWQRPFSSGTAFHATPALADLNGDGRLEVVVVASGDLTLRGVHCLSHQGATLWYRAIAADCIYGSPAIGDINGDGQDEVVCAFEGGGGAEKIVSFTATGADGPTFPCSENSQSSVVIGDLEGDQELDVVVGTTAGKVWAFRGSGGSGSKKWDSTVSAGTQVMAVSLGDVDGDGHLEVLAGAQNNTLYILSHDDGSERGKIPGDLRVFNNDAYNGFSFITTPALVDLDANGVPEMVFGSTDHYLRVATFDQGESKFKEFWRFNYQNSVYSSPAAGDCDLDGKADFVAGQRGSSIYWIDTEHVWSPDCAPWPMFRHDACRTGCIPVKRAFIRGDANRDGIVNSSDTYFISMYLQGSGQRPGCMDAADANDDGYVSTQDATYIMEYVYSGGPAPPPPFPACGMDPREDALTCYSYPGCP